MLITEQQLSLDLAGTRFRLQEVHPLRSFLERQGTFRFPTLETGLFSAARLTADASYTGYDNVWVRDNIYVAYAHLVAGRVDVAVRNITALQQYFGRHRRRFEAIIRGEADPSQPMNRPHIRFDGRTLEENSETWSHAQNDALGYFLWLTCRLTLAGHLSLNTDDWELLGLFVLYFRAIRYWEDEDSGHWEEARKVEASSVGVVVAALREMHALMAAHSMPGIEYQQMCVGLYTLEHLTRLGQETLSRILPEECVQNDPAKRRHYDAALLFLIYPLQVANDEQADQILHDVETHLLGDHGIRRYLGDSFWCANYKALQRADLRTSDVSQDMSARDALLQPGQEAQWCLFDPVLSTIYGRRYQATRQERWLQKQVHHLNRSLSQLTHGDSGFPKFLCPELYYLEGSRYVPNDVTPLLWTQANLSIALDCMKRSVPSGS